MCNRQAIIKKNEKTSYNNWIDYSLGRELNALLPWEMKTERENMEEGWKLKIPVTYKKQSKK